MSGKIFTSRNRDVPLSVQVCYSACFDIYSWALLITLGRVKKREIKKKPKYQVYMVDSYQSTRERVSGAGLAPPDLNRLILFRFSSDKSRPLHVKYIITNKIDYAFKNLKTAEICSIGVSSIVWIDLLLWKFVSYDLQYRFPKKCTNYSIRISIFFFN